MSKVILAEMDDLRKVLKSKFNKDLSYEDILKEVKLFKDNPSNQVQNEIDSYMVDFSIEEIEEAILTTWQYNVS